MLLFLIVQGRVTMPSDGQLLPEDLANGGVTLKLDTLNGAPLQVRGCGGRERPALPCPACIPAAEVWGAGGRSAAWGALGLLRTIRLCALPRLAPPLQVFAGPGGILLHDGSTLTPDAVVVTCNLEVSTSVVNVVDSAVPMPFA